MVHGRPDSRLVSERSTEMGLGFRTNRPRAKRIRVVWVDLSSQAQVQLQAARRGTAWSSSSACRCTMGPGRRSVQPGHQRTPKAAVPWGGSFCFPLMAPRVTPDMGQMPFLNKFARKKPQLLRRGPGYFEKARHALLNGTLIIKKLPGVSCTYIPVVALAGHDRGQSPTLHA